MTTEPDADFTLPGHGGPIVGHRWSPPGDPRYVVLLTHGYGEHSRRYDHLASRLTADGAVLYAVDHIGHGRSAGERVLIEDFDAVVDDVHLAEELARREHPSLPVTLIGHSMGGLIAARYAQRFGSGLRAVVLSGPLIGPAALVSSMLALDEIPDVPLDPEALSRDPEVGRAYSADPLVWHGPFKKPTVAAMDRALRAISAGGPLPVPALWLHGTDDPIVRYEDSAAGWAEIRPTDHAERTYPGARHEIFNELDKDRTIDDAIAFLHERI
ncbi:alpha/beta hydrolase [Tsukamurella strandjordii]|uniref:alpha/beta hydrolase n=1 Tax=Tsukamurella TaxID=2060 RepID=UPI001C7E0794|nr:alpha/beta hydrolase [Tsukamurella sp. TY48]GIZ99096.1 lysophospholipase [Tsukamurella sp. TY48]